MKRRQPENKALVYRPKFDAPVFFHLSRQSGVSYQSFPEEYFHVLNFRFKHYVQIPHAFHLPALRMFSNLKTSLHEIVEKITSGELSEEACCEEIVELVGVGLLIRRQNATSILTRRFGLSGEGFPHQSSAGFALLVILVLLVYW